MKQSRSVAARSATVKAKPIPVDETSKSIVEAASASPDVEQEGGGLADRAYRELEERIVTLVLAPGAVLSEQLLANELGIGRTPIREALQRLARDGLVTILPRRGILVSAINLETQLKVLEVRRELERLMARLAAERADPVERERFAEVAQGMLAASKKADDRMFMRLDRQFNALMSSASRNEFATRSMTLINGLSRRFWYQHYKQAADLPQMAKFHARVAEAIARGKPDAAAEASDDLVDYIESFARKTIDYRK